MKLENVRECFCGTWFLHLFPSFEVVFDSEKPCAPIGATFSVICGGDRIVKLTWLYFPSR